MRTRWLLILVGLLLLVGSCSRPKPSESGTSEVVISSLLKEFGLGSNITRVVLGVSGNGIETVTTESTIDDGVVSIVLDIEIGEDRTFEMTAFNEDDVALYRGSVIADVVAGSPTEVNIKMLPLVPMIRVSEMFSEVEVDGEETIRVFVHNVDSLFGLSFRVEFDSNLVEVTNVSEGNIFAGRQPIFFSQIRSGYVAVAFSLRGNQAAQGVDVTEGTAAVINLTAKAAGTSDLKIPPLTLQLVDWQGNAVPREVELFIEDGEIRVNAP